MGLSHFPNGFKQGISIRGVPIVNTHPGEVFWVNNSSVLAKGAVGGSDGNDGSYQRPYSTITKAIAACTASRGDVILVMPGHAESVASAGAIAFSKAGVALIGLGSGTLRPTFTFTTATTASITVTGANVTISNVRCIGGFADVATAFSVSATNCTLDSIEFLESAADLNFLDYIVCPGANNTADVLKVTNCRGTAIDNAQNSFLNTTGSIDRLTFADNYYSSTHVNTLAMILCATTKVLTDCLILDNYCNVPGVTVGDLLIDNDATTNTGIVARNLIGHADIAGEILVDADGVRQFDNKGTALDTASGYILPAIDS